MGSSVQCEKRSLAMVRERFLYFGFFYYLIQ